MHSHRPHATSQPSHTHNLTAQLSSARLLVVSVPGCCCGYLTFAMLCTLVGGIVLVCWQPFPNVSQQRASDAEGEPLQQTVEAEDDKYDTGALSTGRSIFRGVF